MRAVVLPLLALLAATGMAQAQPENDVPPRTPAAIAKPDGPMVTVVHEGLGLADIGMRGPGGATDGVLHIRGGRIDGELRVPLASVDGAPVRIMTGGPGAEGWIEYAVDGRRERTPAFAIGGGERRDGPGWALGAVWYQVFPERFRNGNPANDPRGPGVFPMKWTADWYAHDPAEEAAWRARSGRAADSPIPQRNGGPVYHWIYDRRYGGDLQGVVEKLDELKELGVTAIYLNPIFQAFSSHKYDATDHRHIDVNLAWPVEAGTPPEPWEAIESETDDPATWTWTPADRYFLDTFLPECRRRGLRVILDGVWNHCGRKHFAFQDVVRNGEKSAYRDWFTCTFDEQGRLKGWKAWDGPNGSLPAFRQTAEGDLVEPAKRHVFAVTRRWMDPNGDGDASDGIDGWRLDVVPDMGKKFWRDWHVLVRSVNPEAVTIAEIWHPAHDYLLGDLFDTQMHYPFAIPVLDWLMARPGVDLRSRLAAAFVDAPQTNLIHQNLFASHDTDRYVSMLWNPGREYDRGNNIQNGDKSYKAGKPPKEVYDLSLLGLAIQATYVGSPMVYYGDEWGMWGADDPTCRKPVPWPDLGANDNPDDVAMPEFRERYREWLRLRQDPRVGPVLRYGDVRHLDTGNARVFAFERTLNGARVVVVVNAEPRAVRAIPMAAGLDARARAVVEGDDEIGPVSARWWYIPARQP